MGAFDPAGGGKIAGMSAQNTDRKTGEVGDAGGERQRRFGLRPIGEAASRVAAPIVARRGGSVLVRLKAQWYEVVGAELARQTWPEKLGRDGALRLRVVPGFALDLQHRALLVVDRINIFFGRPAVTRLVLVQGPLPLAASGLRSPTVPATSDEAGTFDPAALDSRLAGIGDPELRAALAGLAALVYGAPRQAD
jgi:hypothetical protein